MGLDVVHYKNVQFVSLRDDMIDWAQDQDFLWQIVYGEYAAWAGPLKEGFYLFEEAYIRLETSYSGYAEFRDELERLIVKTYQHKRPFRELMNFTDCEGIICPAMCQVMLNDFKCYQQLAEQMTEHSREIYYEMRDALAKVGINDFLSFE